VGDHLLESSFNCRPRSQLESYPSSRPPGWPHAALHFIEAVSFCLSGLTAEASLCSSITMAATGGIIPAQLGFLAIYNPSLGKDETIDDQIVYYASVKTQSLKRRHRSRGKPTDHLSQEERNERLRQIGLAQGMVEFSKGFSGGKPVDTIETERARVILHELEPGWWILAVSALLCFAVCMVVKC
jgi:hypothetical protein